MSKAMDKREKIENRSEVPTLCDMCRYASIQVYELKTGEQRKRVFCGHPRDPGSVLFKVVSCNLFKLLVQKGGKPKDKKP